MSIHKLTAGHGYTYLTRQVAAQDRVERGGVSLSSYYTEKGEAPGTWLGSGVSGLDGLAAGDVVTAEAMMNLFGHGLHPLAEQIRSAAIDDGLTKGEAQRAARLGTPYRVHADDIPAFRQRVAERMAAINEAAGIDRDAPGDPEERARVRTEVAVELFTEDHGRAPVDEREVIGAIAKHSRPRTTAVAGFDLTFSPVKSVSSLWAIADRPVAAAIERAHDLAVQDALAYLERVALFTREGARGVRQVETRGLVAAAFTHRDSRSGDPDLHTHVAIANKVQARESGKWLAIDGRVLYKANVAASETYNTRLEHHLRNALGVRFAPRTDTGPGKRPVREIVGIDARLNQRWSTRRVSITARRDQLARQFHTTHARPPTAIESIHLAQQATLETREAKHEPRSLAEQRTAWADQARQVLGSDRAIGAMVGTVLTRGARTGVMVDAAWMHATAVRIVERIQRDRSHWQRWHVEAEALRQVRGTDLPTGGIDRVVDLLVKHVLTSLSVPISGAADDQLPVTDPDVLRRGDGASVYSVAGSAMFTSPDILAAEQRIVTAAGITDRRRMPAEAIDLAMLASTANGLPLNAGQGMLVREMATSGARVQLAIAPAGAGKTTAMRALTQAWTEGGGTVIGLAPSAAAADVLGSSIQTHADTLAKLLWHLDHPNNAGMPAWAGSIDTGTLVVIDEAGMADTLTLDRIITHVTHQGGSIRLIGDDRQLAAVGAGGILRDIQATHGALHLSELMRFTNPGEGAASLALREGQPEAIGFYLDHGRVHIGDTATLTDDVFTAWAADTTSGRDAIMLAPTRDLVADLNARARTHRLTSSSTVAGHSANVPPPPNVPPDNVPPPASITLADGNEGSVGDTIITRANDRRLRTSGTDWVKNGDRWTITTLHDSGALTVRHTRTRRQVTLPTEYVAASVELGYATTIHTAQGVTADVSHTLLTGSEARTLVYTAATRGRDANHLYVQVGGDGDPHGVIRPELTHPPTPTDLLEQILARDDSARSATTIARDATDPALLLGQAVARYVDSLVVAAQQHLGPDLLTRLDSQAERIVPGITTAASWESLRTHLILAACNGDNPLVLLRDAANQHPLDDVDDPAAVITWRLDASEHHNAGTAEDAADGEVGVGPLPWLPAIPTSLDQHPEWGPYLAARAASVRHLTHDITESIENDAAALPGWARQGHAAPPVELLTDVEIFRAATAVDPADRRPTGPPAHDRAARTWQRHLDQRLQSGRTPAMQEWRDTLQHVITSHGGDGFVPVLAERLSAISRAGLNTPALIHDAVDEGPLPDDHQAAALWWRISGRLSPAVATQLDTGHHLTTAWTERLPELIGATETRALQDSPWWPALVTTVDHAIARGNTLETLFTHLPDPAADLDPCQGLTWRISTLTDTPPPDADVIGGIGVDHHDSDGHVEVEQNPFWDETPDRRFWNPTDEELTALPGELTEPDPSPEPHPTDTDDHDDEVDVEATLAWAALMRQYAAPLEPSDQEIETARRRAYEADTAPVSPERILELNQQALTYYMGCFPGSWAQVHLAERLHQDLTGDPQILPGYAPPGWTNLVNHLRRQGVSDLELTESGLASTTRDGRLIDRFRDRLILPITRTVRDGTIETIGFVARANPHLAVAQAGPKYLNTPDNPLFHKGAQLYVAGHDALAANATPVLVEGPMDAIAITTATRGEHVGVASLGTALTEEQARSLAVAIHGSGREPVLAFDADDAGHRATHRGYWLLAQHGPNPNTVHLRPGSDPADTLTLHGPDALRRVLSEQTLLAGELIRDESTDQGSIAAVDRAFAVLASAPPETWDRGVELITEHTDLPVASQRRLLAEQLQRWHRDPRAVAQDAFIPPSNRLPHHESVAPTAHRPTAPAPQRPQLSAPDSPYVAR